MPMSPNELWQAVLAELEVSLSRANFATWLNHTTLLRLEGSKAIIGVPSKFIQEWVDQKYHNALVLALKRLTKDEIQDLSYTLYTKQSTFSPPLTPAPSTKTPIFSTTQSEERQEKVLEPSLNTRYIFENLVVGKHNELANAAARSVAENPGQKYNPLFMYGGVGLGKTHLLQAVGWELHKQGKRVLYTTSEHFTNQFVKAIRTNALEQFRQIFRTPHALLIDDIQFFSGKEGTQEEFFHTYNALHETNRQLIMTSDRLPRLIPALEARLISRFESGMIVDVSAPDFETRMAILTSKCKEKGASIPHELLTLVAETIRENIRELEGALNKIIASHEFYRMTPTKESVEKILLSLSPSRMRKTTPKKIFDTIIKHFEITMEDLKGKERIRKIAFPRQVAMFLLRDCLNMSFETIGAELGGRDHTTVMYACAKIEEEVRTNEAIQGEVEAIKQKIFDFS